MGLIFDQKSAAVFEEWHRSSQGQAVDAALSRLILRLAKPIAGERVLDIGCGTGNHMLMLRKLGLDVAGLDASPCMIKKAEERLGHRCRVKRGEAEDLPFDDNEFDMAVMIHTLEFLDNPLQALREAGRVARKRVFVGVINGFSWQGFARRVHGYAGNRLFARARFYSFWGLRRILIRAYGDVPIAWGCLGSRSCLGEQEGITSGESVAWHGLPFGPFLGMAASMRYTHRTQPLPLTIGIKKARGSLVRPAVGMEDIKAEQRGYPS
jgi:SAM-dependent methyltransferase